MNLGGISDNIKNLARNYPEMEAVVFNDERRTFNQLHRRLNSLSNALIEMGITKGTHVALFMRNRIEFIESYLALYKIGAVAVPINAMADDQNLMRILKRSDSSAIIIEEEAFRKVQDIQQDLFRLFPNRVILVGKQLIPTTTPYEEMIAKSSDRDPEVKIDDDDASIIIYSSGTTGEPKGILFDHGYFILNVFLTAIEFGFCPGDVMLVSTPQYHSGGHLYSLLSFYLGGRLIITRKFNPEGVLRLIEKEKITHAFFVPSQYHSLLNVSGKETYDISSIKSLVSGGAPLSAGQKKDIVDFFECDFYEHYGSTESGILTMLKFSDNHKAIDSVGKTWMNTEMRIIDSDGNEQPTGEAGEIIGKRPIMFKEYYGDEHLTQSVLLPGGWCKTGDVGKVDEQGYLHIVGRTQDMIISGGVNIFPVDIERVLDDHPKVKESAVIGLPHEKWGEAVCAVVVSKDGEVLSEDELHAYSRERLSGYQSPKRIRIVDSLPRNPTGKVLKTELRERYKNIIEEQVANS